MKNIGKIVLGLFVFSLVLTSIQFDYAVAAPDKEVNVEGDSVKDRVRANERVRYRFRKRTELTIQSNVNTSVEINCDSKDIGDKDVEVELEGEDDLELKMECTEEQKELGLQNGNTYQTRNRNRYRYQEGFCAEIKCNDSCEAKLKIEATEENRNSQWAYYDEDTDEWVTVDTKVKDGYLVAETDHFSTWTVLTPETDYTPIIIGVGIAAAVIIGVVKVILRKRK